MERLTNFKNEAITFIETQQVKEGVEADIYTFDNDSSKDLAMVRVMAGKITPLQRILKGEKTIEGFLEGTGTLTITDSMGKQSVHRFPEQVETEVTLTINNTMQWHADSDLTFYEICWPPYEDGRFQNLSQ